MKLLNTNTGLYKKAVFAYLLDCIDFEGTEQEKVNYIFDCFASEFWHDYNKKYYGNNIQQGLVVWFTCLPSCINIDFENYAILEVAKKLHGVNELTEKQEDTIIENWFNHLAFKLIQLQQKVNKQVV